MLLLDGTVFRRIGLLRIFLFMGAFRAGYAEESRGDGMVLTTPAIPARVTGVLRSLNETLSENVTPAENAVVPLVQIFGVEAFEPGLGDDSLEMLGIAQMSTTAPRFIYAEEFVRSISTTADQKTHGDVNLLMSQIRECGEKVWKRDRYAMVSQFLATNDSALDLVVAASQRPKYYAPMLADTEPPRLLSASLAIERRLPFLAHVLAARAMLRFSERDVAGATSDVLAAQCFAVLLAAGSPFDVSVVKAQIIDNITYRAMSAMLESGQMSDADARILLSGLKTVPTFPFPDVAANKGERAIVHQEIELYRSGDQSVREFFELDDDDVNRKLDGIGVTDLPLKPALQRGDEIQDEFVRALSIRDRQLQVQAFQKLDQDYDRWLQTSDEKTLAVARAIDEDRDGVSRWMGETIAYSLRPWYWQRRMADDRVRIRQSLVTLGLALVVFRGEHGRYPTNLMELAPRILDTVPMDAHSDKPFIYERTPEGGVRLLSFGANQSDDAGQSYNDDLILELK